MINKSPNWVRGHCIGKGSFGTVTLAVNKSDGRHFAVKSVNQTSPHLSQALENEIRILKSLSSPYIVNYLGDDFTSEFSPAVYRNLHMEYMPGGTVADMAEHGEGPTVRSYTRCIVSALSYIHRKNIIHCDVKGRNVLIGGISGAAKLADFGSAAEMGGSIKMTRGSPLWMAPEVVRGEYQGPESDVWSLGCTVIEMVTGKAAWQDRGIDTLCQIGYSDELPELPGHFSGELCDFLCKCLRRDRSERWSCDQLLQHPFLLSCTSFPSWGPTNKKCSPRCVFDWSNTNFSDEESSSSEIRNSNSNFYSSETMNSNSNSNLNSEEVKRRMFFLCCNSAAANWESDGWELVRGAAEEGGPAIAEEETGGSGWPEYGYSGEVVRGGFDDDYGGGGSNNHDDGTSDGWRSRDTYNNYSCCVGEAMTHGLQDPFTTLWSSPELSGSVGALWSSSELSGLVSGIDTSVGYRRIRDFEGLQSMADENRSRESVADENRSRELMATKNQTPEVENRTPEIDNRTPEVENRTP
ncbi:hypothetical protein L6452_42831 [Arctium lappa]|uniref:Uncharacterized protein n=1 Tax=Arctium lappa TaxID=4217 RepID=A0ACB8XJY4_ARCLA|nr:hypothetical protein L6452_42831 [Arctium lappa]